MLLKSMRCEFISNTKRAVKKQPCDKLWVIGQICGLGGRPRTGKGDRRTAVEGEIIHSKKPLIKRFALVFQPFPQRALGPLPCLGTASEVTSANNNLSV